MKFKVTKSNICGTVEIPGSKSHSIRSFFFASFADGRSVIRKPLLSNDTRSAITTCRQFGADINQDAEGNYIIDGFGGKPTVPDNVIDVGNSGTTLRIALSTAALLDGSAVFTGDEQIRNRPVAAVIDALNNLGAKAFTTRNNGKAPAVVTGPAKGGFTKLDGLSSQFLSSILINAPMFEQDTEIEMTRLNELPYVDITTWWLDKLGIEYRNENYKKFWVKGGQKFKPFDMTIPADFSSATFFAVLAAISGGTITMKNLDMTDPQGDKEVLLLLEKMGCTVKIEADSVTVTGGKLKGIDIDMNAIPDALPAMSVAACFAEGETRLHNVVQARYKETDRIACMYKELSAMGADIEELEDGLVIRKSKLKACDNLHGYADHRIVMALSVAGLCCEGETVVDTSEAAAVTFPNFQDLIRQCGGMIENIE
jgi:3-phosphoshikimate 1-carboxyvinyltransferase